MALSSLEAVDLLRFSATFSARLDQAALDLSRKAGTGREMQWLAAAIELLNEVAASSSGLLERARQLPELAELREELAGPLQSAWVDALEKLLAGITFHISGRSPVIEALYPTQKLAPLRRAPADAVRKFQSDFEKRLKGGYVSRLLGAEDFGFARPVVEGILQMYAQWNACFEYVAIPEAEAASIRAALEEAAPQLDVAIRQARHLAEAALACFPEIFEAHQLGAKLRKRTRTEGPNAGQPRDPDAESSGSAPSADAPTSTHRTATDESSAGATRAEEQRAVAAALDSAPRRRPRAAGASR